MATRMGQQLQGTPFHLPHNPLPPDYRSLHPLRHHSLLRREDRGCGRHVGIDVLRRCRTRYLPPAAFDVRLAVPSYQ